MKDLTKQSRIIWGSIFEAWKSVVTFLNFVKLFSHNELANFCKTCVSHRNSILAMRDEKCIRVNRILDLIKPKDKKIFIRAQDDDTREIFREERDMLENKSFCSSGYNFKRTNVPFSLTVSSIDHGVHSQCNVPDRQLVY